MARLLANAAAPVGIFWDYKLQQFLGGSGVPFEITNTTLFPRCRLCLSVSTWLFCLDAYVHSACAYINSFLHNTAGIGGCYVLPYTRRSAARRSRGLAEGTRFPGVEPSSWSSTATETAGVTSNSRPDCTSCPAHILLPRGIKLFINHQAWTLPSLLRSP